MTGWSLALITFLIGVGAPVSTTAASGTTIFTVAGSGRSSRIADGGPASLAGLQGLGRIAATADGGVLVVDGAVIRRVTADGRIATVAGTGRYGFSGDGGPATSAEIAPSSLAVEPDGGYLIAECLNNRVRRVTPDGRITTVAGSGPRAREFSVQTGTFGGDGGPALSAQLSCPTDVAVEPDGGFVIADYDNERVRRVTPDGAITTIAGRAGNPGRAPESTGDGGPATQATLEPDAVAVTTDGSVLVADSFNNRVRRINPDGRISTAAGTGADSPLPRDGVPATVAAISPRAVAPSADGGYLIVDSAWSSCAGEEPRLLRVSHGRVYTVAGSGRYILDQPQGDENRGDGGPARRADLRHLYDVAVASDGGILLAEGSEGCAPSPVDGLVRYIAPKSPAFLAAALVRSRDRTFNPMRPPSVAVALSLPARVTVRVRGEMVESMTASLPAGTTELRLPRRLPARAQIVELTAADDAGRVAGDHEEIYPPGWLTLARARIDAVGVMWSVSGFLNRRSSSGHPLLGCRRLAPARVDCRLAAWAHRCRAVVAIRLRHGVIQWGSYRCRYAYRARPPWQQRPRRVRARDIACEAGDPWCGAHPFAQPFGWGPDNELRRASASTFLPRVAAEGNFRILARRQEVR